MRHGFGLPRGWMLAVCLLFVSVIVANGSGFFTQRAKDDNVKALIAESNLVIDQFRLDQVRNNSAAECRSRRAGAVSVATSELTAASGRALAVVAGSVIDDPVLALQVARALGGDKATEDALPDLLRDQVRLIISYSEAVQVQGNDRASVEADCADEARFRHPKLGVERPIPPENTTTTTTEPG